MCQRKSGLDVGTCLANGGKKRRPRKDGTPEEKNKGRRSGGGGMDGGHGRRFEDGGRNKEDM